VVSVKNPKDEYGKIIVHLKTWRPDGTEGGEFDTEMWKTLDSKEIVQ